LSCLLGLTTSATAQADWEREWKRVVEGATKEGELNFYGNHAYPPILQEFRKKYPEIKVTEILGTAAQLSQRILAERRAGKYLADVYVASPRTAYTILLPAKALDPVSSSLILPEVTDQSKWFQGKHHYVDPEEKYAFVVIGTVEGANIAYNTNLVSSGEIRSYWDFLNPKWKGKITALDPQVGANSSTGLAFFYHHPELGPPFVRRLFADMDIVFTRDEVQLLNWVAVGKFSIGFFVAEIEQAARQGLPIQQFAPSGFKEGAGIGATGRGGLALMNRGPHPNAARVFINWFLSREGQRLLQSEMRVWRIDSMREDISKEEILPAFRRVKGAQYLLTYLPQYADTRPVRALVDEATRGAARNAPSRR
jgi:iron(III) transport system substrate-binding protein